VPLWFRISPACASKEEMKCFGEPGWRWTVNFIHVGLPAS
jgi:hypothetical protein